MKIPALLIQKKKKKLRASTARRGFGPQSELDYEEMAEPNMKLSRALLIVLMLHVVAVAGIVAFNTIKSRQGAFPPAEPAATATEESPVVSATAAPAATPLPAAAENETATVAHRSSEGATPVVARKAEPVKSSDSAPSASGKFYIVAKGDNPVSIARKLKVSQAELMKINNISDPTKLRIGQKLTVPKTQTSSAKSRK